MKIPFTMVLRITFFLSLIFLFEINPISAQIIITTVAGNGKAGYSGDKGLGVKASLNNPTGIAFDHAGHLLITDQLNNVLRRLDTASGIITTVAGKGVAGHTGDGGAAINATLDGPTGIAVDALGNIYIAEEFSFVIRKIDPAGIISTIAGIPYVAGYSGDGGPALKATLAFPTGVAIDPGGNVFIADYNNSVIRKTDITTKNISTVAGNGSMSVEDGIPAVDASFFNPPRICFDNAGDLLIADEFFCLVRKVTMSTGIINTIAGFTQTGYSGDGGLALYARFNHPTGLIVNVSGDIFIADCDNNVIRMISAANGIINTIAGNNTSGYSGDGGDALKASFNHPTDFALGTNGDLYIADAHNNVIRKLGKCQLISSTRGSLNLCPDNEITLAETNTSGTWNSSNNSIVSVTRQGIVKAITAGNATISYRYDNGTCIIIDTTLFTVFPAPSLFLGNDTSICKSLPLLLNAGNNFMNYSWNTGAASNTITVSNAGTYSVAVTDINQCVASDTITIMEAFNAPVLSWPKTSVLCDGLPIVLNTPVGMQVIKWQNGSTASTFTVKEPGTYWVNIIDRQGCSNTDTLKIEKVISEPTSFLSKDTSICEFDAIILKTTQAFSSYLWSTGSTAPFITVNVAGTYSLKVQDPNNCIWKETVTINKKLCDMEIFFPSAFTPNNDGLNDMFRPKVYGRLNYFLIRIYNGWGQKVFESATWQNGWNGLYKGVKQSLGTYSWIATYQLPGSEKINKKGILTLLR